jgi:hypothetical protein
MLLLTLVAFHGAVLAPDQDRRRRTARVATVPARAAPRTTLPIGCDAACQRDPNRRYRLPLASTEIVDGKDIAVRDTGMACGTTGAPVCPSNGTTLVKTTPQ